MTTSFFYLFQRQQKLELPEARSWAAPSGHTVRSIRAGGKDRPSQYKSRLPGQSLPAKLGMMPYWTSSLLHAASVVTSHLPPQAPPLTPPPPTSGVEGGGGFMNVFCIICTRIHSSYLLYVGQNNNVSIHNNKIYINLTDSFLVLCVRTVQ